MAILNNPWRICGFAILYVVTSFMSAFLGFLSPWCWIVVFPALAAFLGAFSYHAIATRWPKFGVATVLSLLLGGFLLALGECELWQSLLMLFAGVLSDLVRLLVADVNKGETFAYPILGLGIIAWIVKLWTNTQWYLDGAATEVSLEYSAELTKLAGSSGLLLSLAATLVLGYLGIKIAKRK